MYVPNFALLERQVLRAQTVQTAAQRGLLRTHRGISELTGSFNVFLGSSPS